MKTCSRRTARRPVPWSLLASVWLALPALSAYGQTIDDGLMMSKRKLCTGFLYSHDSWSKYWEGHLKRDNGNVGTVTTQSVAWYGVYGVNDRLNLIATMPYVWTGASAGTLRGMRGRQDVTVAAKYRLVKAAVTDRSALRAFVIGSVGAPTSDYTADFLPLSIGLASPRASGRLTLNYHAQQGWYANGTASYTRRGSVGLDRPAYFTDGRLYLSDQVAMPDVFDYTVSAGYVTSRIQLPISFTQQVTRGGGDIRRQDMPFVSNRMDFSRVDAVLMYYFVVPKNLALRLAAGHVVRGRNVGQSTTLTAGLLYTLSF